MKAEQTGKIFEHFADKYKVTVYFGSKDEMRTLQIAYECLTGKKDLKSLRRKFGTKAELQDM